MGSMRVDRQPTMTAAKSGAEAKSTPHAAAEQRYAQAGSVKDRSEFNKWILNDVQLKAPNKAASDAIHAYKKNPTQKNRDSVNAAYAKLHAAELGILQKRATDPDPRIAKMAKAAAQALTAGGSKQSVLSTHGGLSGPPVEADLMQSQLDRIKPSTQRENQQKLAPQADKGGAFINSWPMGDAKHQFEQGMLDGKAGRPKTSTSEAYLQGYEKGK